MSKVDANVGYGIWRSGRRNLTMRPEGFRFVSELPLLATSRVNARNSRSWRWQYYNTRSPQITLSQIAFRIRHLKVEWSYTKNEIPKACRAKKSRILFSSRILCAIQTFCPPNRWFWLVFAVL
jgi:hypothetical protein